VRIAQVVTYVSSDGVFGGPIAVALAQTVELARRGHEVHLYAAWDGQVVVDAPGVILHLYRVAPPRGRLSSVFSFKLMKDLRRSRRNFDVIHLHFGRDGVSLTSWLAVASLRSRLILQPHGMIEPADRFKSQLVDAVVVRRALRAARAVLALTAQEREALRNVARRSLRLEQIDNGIRPPNDVFVERPDPKIVLFLARLHPRKNVMVFAEAARRAHDMGSSAVFRVVGPDEGDLPALLEFITRHRLQKSLQYAGPIGPGESVHELARAAVFVLPSVGEVYPMTVLEALSVATPVVLSEDCGLSDALRTAGAAKIVRPNSEAVARAVAALLSDEPQRRAIAARGARFAAAQFDIDQVALQLVRIYASVPT
jgi:glycosyltransferase involved in cell wall biosynthesis